MKSDPADLKNTFARFVTGITIVSCQPEGQDVEPIGLTVNSFTSVSLNPPLVLWCIDKSSSVFDAFATSDNYAVTVLKSDQAALSGRFATPGQHAFEGLETETMVTGAPVLTDRLAALDCRVEARHEAGDHMILIGRVVEIDYSDQAPLMYVGRSYMEGPVITEES